MKFLVDAQLPRSLSEFLCSNDHDSIHTLDLPDKNRSSDHLITQISIEQDRVVVTKDSDFLKSFLIYNQPKKLLLINTGNIANPDLFLPRRESCLHESQ